jgi:hypothetical protein
MRETGFAEHSNARKAAKGLHRPTFRVCWTGPDEAGVTMARRGERDEARRRLGQFFTPTPVAELAAAAAIDDATTRVIDPTCGPGRMLWAAARRMKRSSGAHGIVGIEVDPVLAALACVPPGSRPSHDVHVVLGEAFSTVGGLGVTRPPPPRSFDVVLGNPPYVRYQALAELAARSEPKVMAAATRAFPGRSVSRRVDALVRAALLAPLLPTRTGSVRSVSRRLVQLENLLATPSTISDPLVRAWAELIRAYSGLSDLSLPSWLLGWLLARPEGRIAFVASDSPDRREYGRVLRYFQLRFLQPLLVVEPTDAGWFPGAQVPASLQVYRVRPEHEIMVPLSERRTDASVLRIRIGPDPELRRVRELSGRLDGARLEQANLRGFDVTRHGLADLHDELLARRPGARGSEDAWLDHLEHRERSQLSLVGPLAPPPEVARIVSAGAYCRLHDLDVQAHQGLRTGCNPFFYLRREYGRVHPDAIFGDLSFADDASLFRPVVRRQRDVTDFAVESDRLPWVALVAGLRGSPEDLAALEAHPPHWRRAWAAAGQSALPGDVARWIRRASTTTLTIRGRMRAIPALSAVAPNARPPRPRDSELPSPPAWWYSLPIAPRHEAPIFLARITHDAPSPRLNDRRAPALIDSNFVTFTLGRDAPRPLALLALLASTYVAACLETSATPMGGGALKVEAAHLRQLPVPSLTHDAWSELARLGERLVGPRPATITDTIRTIDHVLVSERARRRLHRVANEHRTRRRARARRHADG